MTNKKRRRRFYPLLLLGLFILGGSGANGAKPYLPEIVNPLLETWRWKQFSRLEGKGVRCISESPDGRVWFGGDSTLSTTDTVGSTTTRRTACWGIRFRICIRIAKAAYLQQRLWAFFPYREVNGAPYLSRNPL